MLIKSLSLKNFQCYSGDFDKNHFEFHDGLNLIIGNNGNGKSKVFDGFYWVLYDQIFDTDRREFTSSSHYGEKLVSDKATRGCDIGEKVTTEACLVVESSQQREYRLTRVFTCKRKTESDWEHPPSTLVIEEKKSNRWQPSTHNAEAVLNMVIPSQIKPYMWFQGEQVDSLMDLTNKSALGKIINLLSDISIYDDLISITEAGAKKSSANLRREQKKLSKNEKESDELSRKYENNLKEKSKIEHEIDAAKTNLKAASSKIDNLVNKIDDATRKSKLKQDSKDFTEKLDDIERELVNKQKSFTSNIFKDYWILKYSQKSLDKFNAKYNAYFKKHQAILNQQAQTAFKLPLNIPQPMHLHEMLKEEKCYVCDREALKGTDAYAHLEKLVERNKTVKEDIFKCDCSDFYQGLYNKSLRYSVFIENTDERISKAFDAIGNLESRALEIKSELDKIDAEFENLIGSDSSESIVSEYKVAQQNLGYYSARVESLERDKSTIEHEQTDIEKRLERLTTDSVDKALLNATKVFSSLHKVAKSTRENVYTTIINNLEIKANSIFQDMTKSNTSFTGKIKLRRLEDGSCIPEIVDSDGYPLTGSNDSNIILVKLSLIMAILTARAKWSDNYTLITDAPTSKMAEEYSMGFYNALSTNFSQSIIMTYDFIDYEDRENFIRSNKGNIGSIHIVKSNYPNGNRDDRSDLNTIVEVVAV